ncbi:cellulose biosynthesis protein BcsN [Bosea sp. UC22_33]|uniref:cellulose biosynthesis protein BcsN n=1 Tax=Bosea sp. UC22_33 TaxID=3350165 RepID=UPI00366DC983
MNAWNFIDPKLGGECPALYGPVARVLAVSWLALLATGCGEQRLTADELVTTSRSVTVDVGRAMALPPAGTFPVTSVTQKAYENAVSQTVSLATRGRTPGENAIHVAFFTAADVPEAAGVEGNLLKEPGIDDFAIGKEMEERLPGVAMAPSAVFVQNGYGPFGYAVGRGTGGEACLYAWQRLAGKDSLFRPKSGMISVRLRVCDPAATEASLLRLAYDYAFNAKLKRPGWNPIGDAPAPAPELGQSGAPIYPQAHQSSFGEAPQRPQAVRPRPERRRSAVPAEPQAPDPISTKPLEGYPTVPPPPAP